MRFTMNQHSRPCQSWPKDSRVWKEKSRISSKYPESYYFYLNTQPQDAYSIILLITLWKLLNERMITYLNFFSLLNLEIEHVSKNWFAIWPLHTRVDLLLTGFSSKLLFGFLRNCNPCQSSHKLKIGILTYFRRTLCLMPFQTFSWFDRLVSGFNHVSR
jgi:hypothetical protein